MSEFDANNKATVMTPPNVMNTGTIGAGFLATGLAIAAVGLILSFVPAHAQSAADKQAAGELLVAELVGGEITPIPIHPPMRAPMSFADLVERVSPAVVSVSVQQAPPENVPGQNVLPFPFGDLFPRGPQGPGGGGGTAQGSGFAISGDGHIVTNNHVVEGGVEFTVMLSDGTELDAELIGTDPATDLAVLRVQPETPLPYVTFAEDEHLRVGDWVVAVGNPFGLGGTVTAGIVSADGRNLGGTAYNDFIQIDAPINSGNSGGPTFDLQGRVIGVNTLIFSPSGGNVGIGFAIPSAVASNIVSQIIENGSVQRGWLGVQIQPIDEEVAASLGLSEAMGAIVVRVIEDTPAERAGFQQGDVVLELNGVAVEDNRDLTRRIGALRPGVAIDFTVWRDGEEEMITATLDLREDLAAAPAEPALPPGKDSGQPVPEEALPGVSLLPAQDGIGVSVIAVTRGSEAEEKGIRPGGVILTVSGVEVSTPSDIADQVAAATEEGRTAVLILIREGAQERFVALRLNTDEG